MTGKQGFQNMKVIIVSSTTIIMIHAILFLQETTIHLIPKNILVAWRFAVRMFATVIQK